MLAALNLKSSVLHDARVTTAPISVCDSPLFQPTEPHLSRCPWHVRTSFPNMCTMCWNNSSLLHIESYIAVSLSTSEYTDNSLCRRNVSRAIKNSAESLGCLHLPSAGTISILCRILSRRVNRCYYRLSAIDNAWWYTYFTLTRTWAAIMSWAIVLESFQQSTRIGDWMAYNAGTRSTKAGRA